TSNKIMSALDLNKPAAEPAKESARSTTFSPGDDDEKGVSAPDYSVFKKHLTRNLKYPKSARDINVTGIVVANFIVRNKKISGGQIEKSLHKDIDEEVIRALSLFTADVDAPDENYSIAINYNLMGNETQADYAPDASAKNFVGQVTVIAYKTSDTGPKAGMTVPVQIQDPELSIQDGLPQFPGGMKAWNDYLSKNLFYPAQARNNNIQGRVIASFVVDTDGTLEDIKVIRGIGGGADEEAVRMLKNSPKWIPGSKDGKPARVAHSLPIIFSLYPSAQAPYPSANQKTVLPAGVEKFSSVEVLPEFAGGMAGWGKYLTANLRYPAEAKSKKITGRVILSFIVEKDGGISDIKVLRGIGGGADEEAVRVLSTSPKWKPGIQNGRAVRVAYTMPIFFQLSQQTGTTTATVNPRESLPAGVNDFASVDILPDPPGGMPGWGKYLTANLKYPDEARRKNITGRVILAFIVEKDGSTSDIKVLRGIGGGADEEAVRVLKSSPKWKPGIDNGQPVRVAYTMPVFFQTSR
ncbi:energy transducer TonB, partial [Daejeonella sp.]|uniref:energy transducer TonB n=1 Tax=Daejeonella sp. TaxID=2805397 RepID=UPI0030BD937F